MRRNRYLLTAVLIRPKDLTEVTRSVRDAFPKGQRRTHFSAERDSARRQALDRYCKMAVHGQVAVAEYLGGDDEQARNACLTALAATFSRRGVRVLVLDTRGPDRDRADRRHLTYLRQHRVLADTVQFSHRGSRDEPLLSLPDAIGWSYGAGGTWQAKVEPIVEVLLAP